MGQISLGRRAVFSALDRANALRQRERPTNSLGRRDARPRFLPRQRRHDDQAIADHRGHKIRDMADVRPRHPAATQSAKAPRGTNVLRDEIYPQRPSDPVLARSNPAHNLG